jgi:hypothetical protein
MSHHDPHRESFTGPAAASDARAALTRRGEGRLAASRMDTGAGEGLGGLWLLLVPLACCGGPLLIAAVAAAGALAWGALGLGAGLLAAVTVLVIRRSCRSSRASCKPGMTGRAQEAQTAVTDGHQRDEDHEHNAAAVAARARAGPRVSAAGGEEAQCRGTKFARAAGRGERQRP